ncbi:hypothetical protein LOY37_14090 [Pseudomonas sp. B21-012]|uniref:hypothetical protein n=1 Tax=Pseudomonas sp. B21-012 TaxID=2895472 RepID=UPI0021602876|nr:hypothetical protein [Pseudomonas sp. B21-012]UVM53509.1 hypothetical protein LOY37_14090 [Pseudomonas sp. B21-012]
MTAESRYLTAGELSSTSGQVDIDLKTGSLILKGPAGGTVIGDLEKGDIVARIDAEPAVEPLRLGGVTLYGELARNLREVQSMLEAHGAGELKVVKSGGESGKHFFIIDGQMFISQAEVDAGKLTAGYTIRTETLSNSLEVMAGLISKSQLYEEMRKNIESISADDGLARTVRQVIREELRPGGMLHSR